MSVMGTEDVHARLDDLGRRIEHKWRELQKDGMINGAERETIADLRMRQASLAEAVQGGHPVGQIESDVAALRMNFEHWLARIDADYAKRGG